MTEKEKLKYWILQFPVPEQESGLSSKAIQIESLVIEKYISFKKWAIEQVDKLENE